MNEVLRKDVAKLVAEWLPKHLKNKRTYTPEQLAYEIILFIEKRYQEPRKELTLL